MFLMVSVGYVEMGSKLRFSKLRLMDFDANLLENFSFDSALGRSQIYFVT